jgi:hypothetical protein
MSLKACGGVLALLLVALGCDKLRTLPGLELAPSTPPPPPATVVMGPWLLDPLSGQVTVAWTTREPSLGRVWYGTREPDHLALEEGQPVKEHRLVLRSLEPATQYRYRVEGGAEIGSFTSAPKPGEGPIQALIQGVNRTNNGDHALVARAAAAERPHILLHTGDMVVSAAEEALWQVWFQEEHDLLIHAPLLVAAGKHELTDDGAAYARFFQRNRRPRYGSLDYGPVHVVTLDSWETPAGMSPAQKAWFEEDLRGVPADRHVWVLANQGPFAHRSESEDEGVVPEVKDALLSAHRVHPIEAVFSGQRAFYERGEIDGIRYFVLGGGGAPLEEPDRSATGVQSAAQVLSYATVQVCGCHAAGRVKDISGKVLDAFTLSDCQTPCGVPGWAAQVAAASVISAPDSTAKEGSRKSKRRSRKHRRSDRTASSEDPGR